MSGFQHRQFDKLDALVHKIFKFAQTHEKKQIKSIITSSNSIKIKLINIHTIVKKYNSNKKNENRQDFIASKIYNYIFNRQSYPKNEDICIVDFGGGNGDVISLLNQTLTTDNSPIVKENCICVETRSDWTEEYKFDRPNVTYLFWDNNTIQIDDAKADILLCMVSLHHMSDDTINTVLTNARRIIKPNGLLLIKEHDNNTETNKYIEWEHYLYHISDCIMSSTPLNVDNYCNKLIHNFKGCAEWSNLIQSNGFQFVQRANRFLDGPFVNDDKNASALYWDIYKMPATP